MKDKKQYSATNFVRNFSQIRQEVLVDEVVEITQHGRVVGALLSPAEYLEYQKWKESMQTAHHELTPEFFATSEGRNVARILENSEHGKSAEDVE